MKTFDLVIIGAGLSGLNIAHHAQQIGMENVLMIEHGEVIGGMTTIYGSTNAFSKEQADIQKKLPLSLPIRLNTTVTGLYSYDENLYELYIQDKQGTDQLLTRKIVIATGALEKPREAYRIAGSRPAGIFTPSMAMQLSQRGFLPGERILVIENSRMSRSVQQIFQDRVSDLLLLPEKQIEILEIYGQARIESVKIKWLEDEKIEQISCDTLIFSKGRIPSTFYLKGTDCERNEWGEIQIDAEGRTNLPRVFAVGSCTTRGDDEHTRSIDLAQSAIPAIFS